MITTASQPWSVETVNESTFHVKQGEEIKCVCSSWAWAESLKEHFNSEQEKQYE